MQTLSYQLFVKKEFGMYMMLGAKKHKVTLLMFIETIVLGAASLTIGITVGVGLAEGIGQLLMKQLEFAGEGYKAFYLPSIAITCVFFFALFVLSAIMNSIKLSRISVLQLVHADAQTERVAIKRKNDSCNCIPWYFFIRYWLCITDLYVICKSANCFGINGRWINLSNRGYLPYIWIPSPSYD